DLLPELTKLTDKRANQEGGRPPQETSSFDNTVAFVPAAALDKMGRYKEAWEQFVPANRAMFAKLQSDFRDSLERERTILSLLRSNPIKTATIEGQQPISLF